MPLGYWEPTWIVANNITIGNCGYVKSKAHEQPVFFLVVDFDYVLKLLFLGVKCFF